MRKIIKNKDRLVYEFLVKYFSTNKKMPTTARVASHFGITETRVYQYYEILSAQGLLNRPTSWKLKVADIIKKN